MTKKNRWPRVWLCLMFCDLFRLHVWWIICHKSSGPGLRHSAYKSFSHLLYVGVFIGIGARLCTTGVTVYSWSDKSQLYLTGRSLKRNSSPWPLISKQLQSQVDQYANIYHKFKTHLVTLLTATCFAERLLNWRQRLAMSWTVLR